MMKATVNQHTGKRGIIYIPIVHTEVDMGSLGDTVRRRSERKLGRLGRKRKDLLIKQFWDETEETVKKMKLPWDLVLVYQDGLPVCGREREIVADLAKSGSRNHGLLMALKEKGATIMGTESLELLLEEYELAKVLAGSPYEKVTIERYRSRSALLLKRRDRFIAQRINETLGTGQTGLVFLGMLHCLKQWLAKDIGITYPLHTPRDADSQFAP